MSNHDMWAVVQALHVALKRCALALIVLATMLGCAREDMLILEPPGTALTVQRPGLYPETIEYNPLSGKFLVGSFREGLIYQVDSSGEVTALVDDPRLCSVLGLAVDSDRRRLWAVNSDLGASLRPSRAGVKNLAAVGIYDLETGAALNYVDLTALAAGPHLINGIALDSAGSAYVTDSFSPNIYRIDAHGAASLFLQSPEFAGEGVSLNGLVVHPDGYLLVVKKSDGSLFKVPLANPAQFSRVALANPLKGADGVVLAGKDSLLVIANQTPDFKSNAAFVLETTDNWGTAAQLAQQAIGDVYPTTATRRGDELYVISSKLNELIQAAPDDKARWQSSANIQRIGRVGCCRQSKVVAALPVITGHAQPLVPVTTALTGPALMQRAREHLAPLSAPPMQSEDQVALGRRLFFETKLSADAQVGCVTCHLPQHWGSDGRARARGVFNRESPRNAPSVFNTGAQTSQHWRGDRESLEDEAERALLGPSAYGLASNLEATKKLEQLGYATAFAQAFPGEAAPVSVANFGKAVAAYQRTLVTPAPFDAYLAGDAGALSAQAQAGLAAFLRLGCAGCHNGALLGGSSFAKFGKARDYRSFTHVSSSDNGRFDVTHSDADKDAFKVPQLRNVAHTAPYFHDGSVDTLSEAVRIMGAAQLGRELRGTEVTELVAFLESLSGRVPDSYVARP